MRIASVVLALTTGVVASAQTEAPVLELRGSLSNPTPTTGEIVRVDVTLTNQGPPSIVSIWTDLDVTGGLVVAVRCGDEGSSSAFQNPARCSFSSLSQGQKVDYSFDVQVGNSASTLSIEGQVVTYTYRSTTASSPTFSIQVPVTPSGTVADLGLDAREEPSPIPVGSAIT
jgi:hypothetical protein